MIYSSIKISKIIMIESLIEKISKRIQSDLKGNEIEEDFINRFKSIELILEENVLNKEINVVKIILSQYTILFNSLLKQMNTMILDRDITEDIVKKITGDLIDLIIDHINHSNKADDENMLELSTLHCFRNLKACINTNQFNLYQLFIEKLNQCIYSLQKDGEERIVKELFSVYHSLIEKFSNNDDYFDWLKYLLDETYSLTFTLNHVYNDINLKYFISLLTHAYKNYITKENEQYDYINKLFTEFTYTAVRINHEMTNLVIYYSDISNQIIKLGDHKKIDHYLNIIDKISIYVIKDNRWLEFIFYFFSRLLDKWNNIYHEKVRNINIDIIINLISTDCKMSTLLIPEFEKIVLENQYNIESIEKICDDFKDLFYNCIVSNNRSFFYLFIKELRKCIVSLEGRSREIQEKLFKVFFYVIRRVSNFDHFMDMVVLELYECIEALDNESKISSNLGQFLISNITELVKYSDSFSREEYSCRIINLLHSFLCEENQFKFIIKDLSQIAYLFNSFYIIGLHSIENNKEACLRAVSNAMGWVIIGCFRRGQIGLVHLLIQKAIDIYSIAKYLRVSEKTLIFIMTMFTTIGIYCSKQPGLYKYRSLIVKELKKEEIDFVKASIKLRADDSEFIKELFDEKYEDLSRDFISCVNS